MDGPIRRPLSATLKSDSAVCMSSPSIDYCNNCLCPNLWFKKEHHHQKHQKNKKSTRPSKKKMATEILPDGPRGSSKKPNGTPVKSISEDFTSSAAAGKDGHKLEKTIDFLVDLLSNGDISKQREAAEALTRLRRGRDRIRAIGATTLLVDRLSSPDVRIREHMMTLLYRLAADEEDKYRQQSRRTSSGSDGFSRRTTTGVIHNMLRGGPGPKAYETAAKILMKLTSIDRLKDSIASSGGVDALIEMLRFKKGLSFQKETIATLISLLRGHDENKARAVRGGLANILYRLVVHGTPEECDMDGILELMAVLATHDWGHDALNQIHTAQALLVLVKSGKLAPQREKMAKVVRALTEDQQQAAEVLQKMAPGNGAEESLIGRNGKISKVHDSNGGHGHGAPEEKIPLEKSKTAGSIKKPINNGTANVAIAHSGSLQQVPVKKQGSTDKRNNTHVLVNGKVPNKGKPIAKDPRDESFKFQPGIQGTSGDIHPIEVKSGPAIPEEFCCPLSKKLMKDPVTIASGKNYERKNIQQWFDKGKVTCPKTRYRLKHLNLKPNYVLRDKISKWCEKNGVDLPFQDPKQQKKLSQKKPDQDQLHEQYSKPAEEQHTEQFYDSEEFKPSPMDWEEASRELGAPPPPPPSSKGHNRDFTFSQWDNNLNNLNDNSESYGGSTEDSVYSKQRGTVKNKTNGDIDEESINSSNGGTDFQKVAVDQNVDNNDQNVDDTVEKNVDQYVVNNVKQVVDKDGDYGDDDDLLKELEVDRPASEEEIARVEILMEVLAAKTTSEPDLRAAALEIHDLAFGCQSLRDEIVDAGAVDLLASLLSPEHISSTQEAGISALLILSLNDENKKHMAHPMSTVVPAVVGLLKYGTEDGREKAASTLFSLSILDENKVSIGATEAIPALVDILSGRDPLSKKAQKDAATCLLTLSIYLGNKARAVRAGVVPHLVALLDDDESLLDLVLAMLAVLSSHGEGREAIEAERILPKLTQIMRLGSDRNIENALTIFSALIMKNPGLIREAEQLGADEIVLNLCKDHAPGKIKIKSKALRLVEFAERYVIADRESGDN
ncbi:unnamed protein product [Calypogeia fissa]